MHPDDAERIASMGVDAIYVSNHGGRQLDAAPSAISALHQIRQRLGPQFPLVFDSGLLLQTLLLATLTGLLSAFAPALRAARLDPVVAIRG
jgi:ABC-type antimicrobial peptide transport system permease subunit